MFIGEAPGRQEDLTGRPFVGQAGKLLDNLLESHSLRREDVFITNVVKCRPPGNRDPTDEEVTACSVHTLRILRLIDPRIIVTLGNHSGKFIFQLSRRSWPGVSRARGRIYKLNILNKVIVVIPTYHPAAALYNPKVRPKLEEDFNLIVKAFEEMGREASKKVTSLLDFIR